MRNMGYFLILAATALLAPSRAFAQRPIAWQPTLESARLTASQTNRLVLVHFWADWCQACKKMDRDVFAQNGVGPAVEANFVPVKVNADHFPATCRQYGVSALPTDIVITADGRLVGRFQGATDAPTYVARLNQVAASMQRADSERYAQVVGPQAPVAATTQPQDYSGFDPATLGPAATARYADPYAAQPRPSGAMAGPVSPPPSQTPHVEVSLPQMPAESARSQVAASVGPPGGRVEQPSGNPSLGLDGYCPVQLRDDMDSNLSKWTMGDRRWGAIHRGRTYLFAGPEQQQRFLADPDRYAPALSGNDVVMAVEQGQAVPGRREHGVDFGGRVYLFASETTLEKFSQSPQIYAARVLQAMRGEGGQRQPIR